MDTNVVNKSGPSDYLGRIILIAMVSLLLVLVLALGFATSCSADDEGFICSRANIISVALPALLAAFLTWQMVVRPAHTHSDVERRTAMLAFNETRRVVKKRTDLDAMDLEDQTERLRIAREMESGLARVEIRERELYVESKSKILIQLSNGVVTGAVTPDYFAQVLRLLASSSPSRTAPRGPARLMPATEMDTEQRVDAPDQIPDPTRYRLVSVGGRDSPIDGHDIRPMYLTCSIRSLVASVAIAEIGRQPTRTSFQAHAIKGSEEIAECQQFLRDAGVMDVNTSWGAWADKLDRRKFARWIAWMVDTIERSGGESIYRKSAQMMTDRQRNFYSDKPLVDSDGLEIPFNAVSSDT